MSITYSELRQALKDWTENDSMEFDSVIDRIIDNAEIRIAREADLSRFRKTAITTLSAGDKFLAKPTDIVVDRYLKITVSGVMKDVWGKSPEFVTSFWPDETQTGTPRYYADWDEDTFIFAPSAASAYTVTLGYTRRDAGLSSSNTTNWLSTNAPDALLYAALIESAIFNKATEEEVDLAAYKERYQQALVGLKYEEEKRQRREESRWGEIR